ncbi:MAG: hypothetical protein EPN84_03240 [Legionella sp.]|nr:MAG: hypothetical protein EPN84_03240 [Legionella sp.]
MKIKNGIYIFVIIGLLLGIFLDYCVRIQVQNLFYPTLVTLFALLYSLAYDEQNSVQLIGTSFVVALLLSLPLFPIQLGQTPTHPIHFINFMIAYPLFVYVGHSFHYAFHRDQTLNMSYRSLFEAVWNTIPLLFVASIFSSLASLLLMLGASVFKSVGNDLLWDLYFNNHHFHFITNTTLFFIGLGIGQQNNQVIYNIRILLLKMMYYLFPVLAFISILYCVLYLVSFATGGEVPIEPLIILIPLSTLGIIFFNSYFQDGDTENPAPHALKIFLRIYRVILLILVLLTVYKIFRDFNIETNALISLLTAIGFASSYGLTAHLSEADEKNWIQRGNIATAWFFVITLFLTNIPYLPIDFTIRSSSNQPAFNSILTHF